MYDLKAYASQKEKGLINKVQKTNTDVEGALTYAVYEKQFEPDLTQVPPVYVQVSDKVTAITHKELEERKAELEAELQAIEDFQDDAVNGN